MKRSKTKPKSKAGIVVLVLLPLRARIHIFFYGSNQFYPLEHIFVEILHCKKKFTLMCLFLLLFISHLVPQHHLLVITLRQLHAPDGIHYIFVWFKPKVIGILLTRLGPIAWPSASVGFKYGTLWFKVDALSQRANLPRVDALLNCVTLTNFWCVH